MDTNDFTYIPVRDVLAQINHQAYGSHAIVDDEFDHFDDIDLIDHQGHFNRMFETSDAR